MPKILLIEDDANLLYGLQAKFRVQGYDVLTDLGTDEEEIFRKLKSSRPDFIVLDIVMPAVDGFKILSRIKAGPETSKIPVFIFTDLSDADSRERAKKMGVEVYLVKNDFNLDEFVDKFKTIAANLKRS